MAPATKGECDPSHAYERLSRSRGTAGHWDGECRTRKEGMVEGMVEGEMCAAAAVVTAKAKSYAVCA